MTDRSENGPLQVGEVFLEKYQILGLLGRGGHGCVYRALNLFMGREVAIKVLSRSGGLTEELRQRGRQEAALLGSLEHPNIVRVYDAGISDSGYMYLVMELLEGQTLADSLHTSGPMSVLDGLELLALLCDALECAHAAQAVHRDLKPANIFLTKDGIPKILDFGVAKIAGAAGFQTQKNMVVGTILYMSPEQIQGQRATPRSDIYALGLVAFQLFCGSHPLLLGEPNLELHDRKRLAWMQAKKPTPRLDRVVSGIPDYVARMVNVATVKPPGRRFESARQMGATARKFLLRYETEVSLGYHLPPKQARDRDGKSRQKKARIGELPAAYAPPEGSPSVHTERLFTLGGSEQVFRNRFSSGAENGLSFASDSEQGPSVPVRLSETAMELPPLELSEPRPVESLAFSENVSPSITSSTQSLPACNSLSLAGLRRPARKRFPLTSAATRVFFSWPGMSDRWKVGVVATLGFAGGLSSLFLLPPLPGELGKKEGQVEPADRTVVESVQAATLGGAQPKQPAEVKPSSPTAPPAVSPPRVPVMVPVTFAKSSPSSLASANSKPSNDAKIIPRQPSGASRKSAPEQTGVQAAPNKESRDRQLKPPDTPDNLPDTGLWLE